MSLIGWKSGKGYEHEWLELPEGHSWGLWRANLDRLSEYFFPAEPNIIDEGELLPPDDFKLYQNYPNPFNPTTKISFSISAVLTEYYPELRKVLLKVFDILGNKVATLVDKELTVGNYAVEFDASDYSSGVYFYRLTAGNFTATKKMILLR